MNRNLSNYYSKLIDDGAATERDIYDALYAGIRNEDLILVEKSLSMLPSQEKWDNVDYPDPMDFAIDEMASNGIIPLLIDKGYNLDHYPPRLSLFNFSPKEMISFYKKNYPKKDNPYEEVFIHIIYYLDIYKDEGSCYRVPFNIDSDDEYKPFFTSYIDSWCCNFIDVVCEETIGEVKDKIIWGFFESSVKDADLRNLFIKTRELVKEDILHKHIDIELNKAIYAENELAFDYLLPIADIHNLSLSFYPRNNTKMLEKTLSLGQLTPGTETGFIAFSKCIRCGEVDHEILCRIIHPSYYKKRNKEGWTPLMLAVNNRDFPSSDYHLLFGDKSDLEIRDNYGQTALHIAALSNPDVLEDLIAIGADPTAKDNKGNNVLHLLARNKDFLEIQFAMSVLPLSLLEDRNHKGLPPMDVIRERITKGINYAI